MLAFGCARARRRGPAEELRLDDEEAAKASEHGPAIVPGKFADSVAWRIITSADPDRRMPPATPARCSPTTRSRRFAARSSKGPRGSGIGRSLHRTQPIPPDSYCPPGRWVRLTRSSTPLDWHGEALNPAPPPIRTRFCGGHARSDWPAATSRNRRLPRRPCRDAYERVVDRLLRSPRFGERMAVRLARCGPLRRHQRLPERWRAHMWRVARLGRSTPSTRISRFDQFTIEQLAGEMLPASHARPANRHRLSPQPSAATGEGGIIPEEYAVNTSSIGSKRRAPSGWA